MNRDASTAIEMIAVDRIDIVNGLHPVPKTPS
jgi:hypothetical protein